VSVSQCDAIQAVESIRLKMAKTGSIASSSFDSGATVALIGNAVGYVGPMIARPLFQSAMRTSSGIVFSAMGVSV
jgi:hypothetical protein